MNTLLFPLPQVNKDNLAEWYKPDMTTESTCFGSPPGIRAVEDSYFDQLLVGGEDPAHAGAVGRATRVGRLAVAPPALARRAAAMRHEALHIHIHDHARARTGRGAGR